MATNNYDDLIQVNEAVKEMFASEDALATALTSDKAIVRSAARLAQYPVPQMTDDVSLRIWSMIERNLLAAPKRDVAAAKTPSSSPKWLMRLVTILLIIIGLGVAAKPFSADSLPGEFLYPIKLSFERMDLLLAQSTDAQAAAYLMHTQNRLMEAQAVSDNSVFEDDIFSDALTSFSTAISLCVENNLFEQNPDLAQLAEMVASDFENTLEEATLEDDERNPIVTSLADLTAQIDTSGIVISPEETPEPEATDAIVIDPIEPLATATSQVTAIPTLEATAELTELTEIEPTDTGEFETGTPLFVNGRRVNVRSGAGTSFDIVDVVMLNDEVVVLDTNATGTWLEVRLPNGRTGWIATFLLNEYRLPTAETTAESTSESDDETE